jgi:hypothetical protein
MRLFKVLFVLVLVLFPAISFADGGAVIKVEEVSTGVAAANGAAGPSAEGKLSVKDQVRNPQIDPELKVDLGIGSAGKKVTGKFKFDVVFENEDKSESKMGAQFLATPSWMSSIFTGARSLNSGSIHHETTVGMGMAADRLTDASGLEALGSHSFNKSFLNNLLDIDAVVQAGLLVGMGRKKEIKVTQVSPTEQILDLSKTGMESAGFGMHTVLSADAKYKIGQAIAALKRNKIGEKLFINAGAVFENATYKVKELGIDDKPISGVETIGNMNVKPHIEAGVAW